MRGTRHARHRHYHHAARHIGGRGNLARKIARLEEHQRDLEEETAEVAELIKRLRSRSEENTPNEA
jgi:hypothetical protein